MVTTNCTATHFYCITALKTFKKYTAAEVQNPANNSCSSGATLTLAEEVCTDNQYIATPGAALVATISGTIPINFASQSAVAMHDLTYVVWMGQIMVVLSLGLITFLLFMRRK